MADEPRGLARARQRRLREHFRLIDDGVAPVVAAYREHIQCARGCSSCCSQSFSITEVEAEALVEGLERLDEAERAGILARARDHREGDACPVLTATGACQLYEDRPRICRKYGIPLWNPERPERVDTCALNFREVADLDPQLIVEPQAAWATDWIDLRRSLGLGPAQRKSIAVWLAEAADPRRRLSGPPESGPISTARVDCERAGRARDRDERADETLK
ncbi:MAG: hypothetical protein B7733_15245 [Myxococcales bacterium FL481]|nr:MAG: hypothetical protein B7733_15245 [Myxococcales bacterium FL481]